MGAVNGNMTLEILIDGMTISHETSEKKDCSGCNNSCKKNKTKVDLVKQVELKSKCCKKYKKKKKTFCSRCPKRRKGVA
tara:strand:- start:727 stop:963 length:237 start_codon:yes stop_codon:yes gene_type:complete